jgi:Prolyl oligopeptidase family
VGRTLLAGLLQEVSLTIDYAASLPESDPSRVGFIGHSYGGRMAIWAPAWDQRIHVSVSNCGCIPYRDSFAQDAGFQADFVVPGFASAYDVEDVLAAARACRYLLIVGTDDVWSRGAADIAGELTARAESRRGTHPARRARVPCRRPRAGLRVPRERARLNGACSCPRASTLGAVQVASAASYAPTGPARRRASPVAAVEPSDETAVGGPQHAGATGSFGD